MTDNTVEVGAAGTLEWTIEAEDCIRRGDYDIFSTPRMVAVIEWAAIQGLAPYLAEDQESVGTRVDVAHLAASLLGQKVTVEWKITAASGRRVSFEVAVADEQEAIGRAEHDRFIVDIPVLEKRLQNKRSSLS
ncbi:thioesterase family protein [Aeromicrobium piscarium]|uniref:Fluoroacetyl-CoA-specific thioesterase-like domain-containing protein n=1 Tax=Aeromicrobium piscarium TaxID=2590901 RepID=A0A554S7L7_9ACTN|nr:hypothetical protein [Aeromicrobium piscarium]TSD62305.1 hypothetical protein FNM00_11750 [Aeromicrobium piscarium]